MGKWGKQSIKKHQVLLWPILLQTKKALMLLFLSFLLCFCRWQAGSQSSLSGRAIVTEQKPLNTLRTEFFSLFIYLWTLWGRGFRWFIFQSTKQLHWAPTRVFPFNNNHRRGQSGRGAQRVKCPLVQKADVRSWPTSLSSLNPRPLQDDFVASPLKHCCNFHSHYNFPPARGAPRCFSSQDSPASSLRIPEIPRDLTPSGKSGYSISTWCAILWAGPDAQSIPIHPHPAPPPGPTPAPLHPLEATQSTLQVPTMPCVPSWETKIALKRPHPYDLPWPAECSESDTETY